ncbi:MAG: chemotaxis protein CheW [Cyanobacteriota bacterium]|nr:chemotaxis protein CheW [Cyanobacteriota bacterium]
MKNQFMTFYIAHDVGAMLPTEELAEIISLEPKTLVPIPDMSASVCGCFPWQGEVLWLVDLVSVMGYEALLKAGFYSSKYNVLQVKIGGGLKLAFLVKNIGRLIRVELAEIEEGGSSENFNPILAKYIKASWSNKKEETFHVLDFEAIAKAINN